MTPEEKKKRRSELLTWAAGLVASAQGKKVYGKLVFVFEDGNVVRAFLEESFLPPPCTAWEALDKTTQQRAV